MHDYLTKSIFNCLSIFGMLLSLLGTAEVNATEEYPIRTINLVVPFNPGGPTDNFARVLADNLTQKLGQPVVVLNKGGAGGTIGAQYVARSKPDGYTLLVGTAATNAINASLMKSLPYDALEDFSHITLLNTQALVLLAGPNSPPTLEKFIKKIKAEPGKNAFASAGIGTTSNIYGEIINIRTGMDLTHVSFKGSSAALQSVLSGDTQFLLETFGFAQGHIVNGSIKPLAIGATTRSPKHPDVPTFQEAGIRGIVPATWALLAAPRNTPPHIINKLNAAVNGILADPAVWRKFEAFGFDPAPKMNPEETKKFVASEIEKYRTILREANIPLQ